MKIFMPTANAYTWAAETSAKLLAKYWPNHPPVDVAHFERAPRIDLPGFSLIDMGWQTDCPLWIEQFTRYLERHNHDELLLLTLDDYGLIQSPDETAIAAACDLLHNDRYKVGVALTWQPCTKLPLPGRSDLIRFPPWAYSVNTQAGIWRRTDLLRILSAVAPGCGPWDFEIEASAWFNAQLYPDGYRVAGVNCPDPPLPSAFVDSVDKTCWAFAYNNLIRRRQRDPRHDAFLRAEGLLPCES